MATLPSQTSITQYLSTKGQDSSYSARKKLFKDSGLADRLGEFQGTSAQNLSLLKYLQGKETSPLQTPNTPAPNYQPAGNGLETPAPVYVPPPPTTAPVPSTGQATSALGAASAPAPVTAQSIKQGLDAVGAQASKIQEGITKLQNTPAGTGAPIAGQVVDEMFPGAHKSEADLLKEYMDSPEFKLFSDKQNLANMTDEAKAEALKAELETKYASDKASLEEKLAENGLAFSGIRATQVKALADSLASSILKVDRDTASKLLGADIDLRDNILKGVAEVVKRAEEKDQKAIEQLNKVGLAVVNGQLVPTLEAQQKKFSQEQALATFNQRLNEFDALQKQRDEQNSIARGRMNIAYQNARTSQERNAILRELNTANLLAKTASSPGQIVVSATGFPAKLTDGQRTKYAGYDNLLNVFAPKVESLLNKVTTGGAQGRVMKAAQTVPFAQNLLSADQQDFLTTLQELANERLYTQSGAQINEQEFTRIANTLPRPEFSNAQNAVQLANLKEVFKDIYNARLRLEGLSIAGDNPSNFAVPLLGETLSGDGADLSDLDFTFE